MRLKDEEAEIQGKSVIRQMEKLVICYEQQSKCIAELEEYIDELERTNSMKDEQIERLKGSKEREMELELQESIYQKEATRD